MQREIVRNFTYGLESEILFGLDLLLEQLIENGRKILILQLHYARWVKVCG